MNNDNMKTEKHVRAMTFKVKLADPTNLKNIHIEDEDEDNDIGEGLLSGYFSTFNTRDLDGDVIRKGAFTKTLSEKKPKVLYQHNPSQPIGVLLELFEDEKGLFGVIKLNLDIQLGREVFSQYKMGAMDSFSIGFQLEKFTLDEIGFDITEVRLFEVSAVTFPANEQALVESVKEHFKETQFTDNETINTKVREAETVDELLNIITLLAKAEEHDNELAKFILGSDSDKPDEDLGKFVVHLLSKEAVDDNNVKTEEPDEDHSLDNLLSQIKE